MDWTCTHNIATACRAAVVNAPDDLYTTWRLQGGRVKSRRHGWSSGPRSGQQSQENKAQSMYSWDKYQDIAGTRTGESELPGRNGSREMVQSPDARDRHTKGRGCGVGPPMAGKMFRLVHDGGRRTAAARSRRLDRSRESRMLSSTLVIARTITAQPWRRCVSVSAATKARASRA